MSDFWVKYEKLGGPLLKTSFFSSKKEMEDFIESNRDDYDFKVIEKGDKYAPKRDE